MTQPLFTNSANANIISHETTKQKFDLSTYEKNLKNKPETILPLDQELDILKQLSQFELGRFLLRNKGLNGYWTAYIILSWKENNQLHSLEEWLLKKSPTLKATQERFRIFKQQTQKYLKNGDKIASIPCGLMDDLLGLDYKNLKNIEITGIDLDEESLRLAQENAKKHGINSVNFAKKDAWNLKLTDQYNIINSNGLNIYEPNDQKVILLYKEFYKTLKPGGILITSFLTPPPALSKESTWENYNPEDAIKQAAIFSDVIQSSWQSFRTEQQTRKQLEEAGFSVIEVIYDERGMFPTVVAQKPQQQKLKL